MHERQLPPNFVSPKARRDIDEMEKENDLRVSRHVGFRPGESISTFYNPDGTAKSTTLPIYTGTPAAETFGATGDPGAYGQLADGLHRHAMPADPVIAHIAAADPHTQYATDTNLADHVAASDPHTGYIQESLFDTKGDQIVASADNTPVKVPVSGTNGNVWTEDSTQPGGVKWAPAPGSGSAVFTVREEDGTPSVNPITILRFPNATLTDHGSGDVSYTPAGGGGNAVYYSAYASPPGSPNAGDVWLPPDAPYLFIYDGTNWQQRGPIWDCGRLANHPTTWVNQGTATMSQANGVTSITAPTATNPTWRLLVKTAPSPPYKITARIMGAGNLSLMPALIARASGSGIFGAFFPSSSTVNVSRYSSPTALAANNGSANVLIQMGSFWYRFEDDNTNKIWSYSQDGFNFIPLFTEGRTTNYTADQVGFGINPNGAGITTYATLVQWVQS